MTEGTENTRDMFYFPRLYPDEEFMDPQSHHLTTMREQAAACGWGTQGTGNLKH